MNSLAKAGTAVGAIAILASSIFAYQVQFGRNDGKEIVPIDTKAAIEAKFAPIIAREGAKGEEVPVKAYRARTHSLEVELGSEVPDGAGGLDEPESRSREDILNDAMNLTLRRQEGDEPTQEEWLQIESEMDSLRTSGDGADLEKIDRLLEVSDASPEVYAGVLAEFLNL